MQHDRSAGTATAAANKVRNTTPAIPAPAMPAWQDAPYRCRDIAPSPGRARLSEGCKQTLPGYYRPVISAHACSRHSAYLHGSVTGPGSSRRHTASAGSALTPRNAVFPTGCSRARRGAPSLRAERRGLRHAAGAAGSSVP